MILDYALNLAEEALDNNMFASDVNETNDFSIDFVESYTDTTETINELSNLFNMYNSMESAYEDLSYSKSFIEENGITRQLAVFIDKEHNIIPESAFESLSGVSEKNEEVVMSVEGVIGKVWEGIKKFFAKIRDFIVKMFVKAKRFFQNAYKALDKLHGDLKDKSMADVDKKKYDKIKIKSYKEEPLFTSKLEKWSADAEFEKTINDLKTIKEEIKSFEKATVEEASSKIAKLNNTTEHLFTKMKNDAASAGFIVNFEMKKVKNKISKVSFKITGSNYSNKEEKDLSKEVSNIKKYVNYIDTFKETYKKSQEKFDKTSKKIKEISDDIIKYIGKLETEDDADTKFVKDAIGSLRVTISAVNTYATNLIKAQTDHAFLLVSVGKKIKSTLKKD